MTPEVLRGLKRARRMMCSFCGTALVCFSLLVISRLLGDKPLPVTETIFLVLFLVMYAAQSILNEFIKEVDGKK